MISQYVNPPLVNSDGLSTDRLLANRDLYFGFYIVRDGSIMRIDHRWLMRKINPPTKVTIAGVNP